MRAIIIGAGGFGKELAFLLSRQSVYDLVGFVDDAKMKDEKIVGIPVLGKIDILKKKKK